MEKIEHFIILMMENRSFDHYLGSLSLPPEGRTDVDGLRPPLPVVKDKDGKATSSWTMDGIFDVPDPPHGWSEAHADYHGGHNDGFVIQYQLANPQADPRVPMGYYTRETLPVLYKLADQFTICDRWFGSVLSSTWPNRKYLHSGQRDDDNDTQTLPAPPGFKTTPIYDVIEDASDKSGNLLTWKCYLSDVPFLAFWYMFALNHVNNFSHVAEFVIDCQADRLPTVSIIDPPFTLADDHPAHNPSLGEKFIGLVVDALTHTESWESSALIILYDENGGFYDHVPPPACFEGPSSQDSPLGFRVPAIVVSPYAKRRYVSKTVYDHTSIMKSISARWGVQFDTSKFGPRWEKAPDIWDCFDFTQAPLPMGAYTGDPLRTLNWGSGIHERFTRLPDRFEALLERIFVLPELKALDRRAQLFETLTAFEQRVITLKRMY